MLVGLCLMGGVSASGETVDRIVAVVNDAVITEADLAAQMNALLDDPEAHPAEMDPRAMRHAILMRLIEQQIILQEAKRAGITIGSDEAVGRLEEIRQRFDSEEAFQQSLANANLSEERFKSALRDQLVVQRVIETQVRSTITVSPQEVATELEAHPELSKPGDRVHAWHLLVRVDEHRDEQQAKALIETLHRQLQQGADFAALAKRYSEDSHRDEGGDMGWVAQGELLPELDATLLTLPMETLSGPIQTRLGFHLVKVTERRSAASLPLTEANHAISQQLYRRKFQVVFNRWITDLKRRAYIEIVPADQS